jgi:hypothetical protein
VTHSMAHARCMLDKQGYILTRALFCVRQSYYLIDLSTTQEITRCHVPDDINLYIYLCANLKYLV